MIADLILRPYQQKDLSELVALWRDSGLVTPWNDPHKDIQRKLRVQPDLFLVAEIDDNIIGSVMGGYDGHRGWINYLAVASQYQHHGVAKALVTTVEEGLRKKGCPKINLQVRSNNSEVISFYDSLGYGVDDVISMGKRLVKD